MPHRRAAVADDAEQAVLRGIFVERLRQLEVAPAIGVDQQQIADLFEARRLQVGHARFQRVVDVLQQASGGADGKRRLADAKALEIARVVLLAQ
jgi:hypothetical protein